ncbi:MAG: hypothetical protein ACRD2D_00335 [Terriglobales bacterium]
MQRKRFCFRASFGFAVLALAPGLWLRAQSPPEALAIKSRLIANFRSDQLALERFTHQEHVCTDKDGVRDGRTLRVWYVNGREVSETVALDNRALSSEEIAAEHARAMERARQAGMRDRPPAGMIVFEGKAYSFEKLAGDYVYGPADMRIWGGRTVWVYPARPNPDAPSRSRAESLLLHSQGEIWVDAEDLHVMRVSLHTTAPVRYGLGVLATIHHAQLDLQLQREAPGLWLPAEADFSLDATILMVRKIARSKTQTYSDYSDATSAAAARPATHSRPRPNAPAAHASGVRRRARGRRSRAQ